MSNTLIALLSLIGLLLSVAGFVFEYRRRKEQKEIEELFEKHRDVIRAAFDRIEHEDNLCREFNRKLAQRMELEHKFEVFGKTGNWL